jgi:dipeptide/tripeptide permease
MWAQYKRTARYVQAVILLTCAAMFFVTGGQPMAVLMFFIVMQVSAFVGAAWAANLKQRQAIADARRDRLPLER